MSSKGKSAPRGKRRREPLTVAEVREQLARRLEPESTTDSLIDEIARCPDSLKASVAIARAIAADERGAGDRLLPAAGWLHPV